MTLTGVDCIVFKPTMHSSIVFYLKCGNQDFVGVECHNLHCVNSVSAFQDPQDYLKVTFALKPADGEALEKALLNFSDPHHSRFRQYLSRWGKTVGKACGWGEWCSFKLGKKLRGTKLVCFLSKHELSPCCNNFTEGPVSLCRQQRRPYSIESLNDDCPDITNTVHICHFWRVWSLPQSSRRASLT